MKAHSKDSAILVTGSSGFVGRVLLRKLADGNQKIVCVYRHRLPEPMAQVFPICSDLESTDTIKASGQNLQAIVHLAWDRSFFGPETKLNLETLQLDYLPTANLRAMKSLIKLAEDMKVPRFVFVSVLGADRYRDDNTFMMEKYLAEVLLLNSKIPEKIIVKSGLICGTATQQDNFMKSVIGIMKFPVIYPVPNRRELVAPVFVEDFAECLKKIAIKGSHGPLTFYEIAGPEALKVEDVFKLISDRMIGGGRLQIKGYLGQSLLPFFEGQSKVKATVPSVSQFLSIQTVIPGTQNQGPSNTQSLIKDMGLNMKSFRDVIASQT